MNQKLRILKYGACTLALALLTACFPYPHKSVRSVQFQARVLDARTHAPIEGARVFLSERPKTFCITDATGHFRLKTTYNYHIAIVGMAEGRGWPPGIETDKVTVSRPGYLPCQVHTPLFRGEDILLEPSK